MTIYYLLIENVNLEEEEGINGKKTQRRKKVIPDKIHKFSNAKFPGSIFQDTKHAYNHTLRFKRRSKHYDHRVKWFTTKNKKKRIKMFRRSSKRITKTRQITPHAMCRHMVNGKTTFKVTTCGRSEIQRRGQTGQEGHQRYRFKQSERERITQSPPLLPNQSLRLICHFLSFFDPISTE